jgi:hypothetical protein
METIDVLEEQFARLNNDWAIAAPGKLGAKFR